MQDHVAILREGPDRVYRCRWHQHLRSDLLVVVAVVLALDPGLVAVPTFEADRPTALAVRSRYVDAAVDGESFAFPQWTPLQGSRFHPLSQNGTLAPVTHGEPTW